MSIAGMTQEQHDRWRQTILNWLKINPPCPSMLCSIDEAESECFQDTEHLVRTFQIMVDSGELESDDNGWTFRTSVNTQI